MKLFRYLTAAALTITAAISLSACSPADFTIPTTTTGTTNTQTTPAETPKTTDTTANTDWDETTAPNYYLVTGEAQLPNAIPAGVTYGGYDNLHRPTTVTATITYQMRKDGSDRDRDMPDQITGWPTTNPKVTIPLSTGKTYKGYMFNRSHLLAKSLGGKDDAINMITGTRTQNVGANQPAGGMAYTETLARDWLDKNHAGTVAYVVTPNYVGNELLPRTVTVDIKTSDNTINQHVIVYNTAKGYTINYANASFTQN
jgi:DNA-entry nuclease